MMPSFFGGLFPALLAICLSLTLLGCPKARHSVRTVAYEAATTHAAAHAVPDLVTGRAELRLQGAPGLQRLPRDVEVALGSGGQLRLHFLGPFGAPVALLSLDGQVATLVVPGAGQAFQGSQEEALAGLGLASLDLDELVGLLLGALPRLPLESPSSEASSPERRVRWASVEGELVLTLSEGGQPEGLVDTRRRPALGIDWTWEQGWALPRIVDLRLLGGAKGLRLRWKSAPSVPEPGAISFALQVPAGYRLESLAAVLDADSAGLEN